MGVVFTQESNYAKEMVKHEAYPTQFGPPGRPYVFREYPKRLYKADRVDGQIKIVDAQTAHDDHEERNLLSRDFHFGPDKAMQAIEQQQLTHGTLAAEREWQIQHGRVSEKAASEVRAAEAEHGARHLPDVPETPVRRRRGRQPKAE